MFTNTKEGGVEDYQELTRLRSGNSETRTTDVSTIAAHWHRGKFSVQESAPSCDYTFGAKCPETFGWG